MPAPFILVTPSTRGLSLALTRHLLRTTSLPVFATHRRHTADQVKHDILQPFSSSHTVDPSRLHMLHVDLTSESSIQSASSALREKLSERREGEESSYLQTAFLAGGMLYPEKKPEDLDLGKIEDTFRLNVFSHLMLIKHFSSFLPTHSTSPSSPSTPLSKWVHVTARVGSISDNQSGGWYSYRSSKAALNQVIKTFDRQLEMQKVRAMCVGVHPGTMKTELSKGFWESGQRERLFEPEDAAEKLVGVVEGLKASQRGRIWDWKGDEVMP